MKSIEETILDMVAAEMAPEVAKREKEGDDLIINGDPSAKPMSMGIINALKPIRGRSYDGLKIDIGPSWTRRIVGLNGVVLTTP